MIPSRLKIDAVECSCENNAFFSFSSAKSLKPNNIEQWRTKKHINNCRLLLYLFLALGKCFSAIMGII